MTKKKISNGIYLFTLGMLCAFAPMCSDMYLPALPMLMEYFNTNPATVQMSLTASFIGLAVGQLFIGPILGPIVGSFVLSISTWQTIFYILVVWGILLLVLSKGFVDETLVVEKRAKSVIDSLRQMKTDILNLKFMLTAISLSFIMGGFFSYLAASPFVFQVIYPLTGCENTAIYGGDEHQSNLF